MKKIIATLFIVLMLQSGYSAVNALQIDDKPEPGVRFECPWVNLRQTERDAKIRYHKKLIFDNGLAVSLDKKTFKQDYRGVLQDKRGDRHYKLITNENVNETADNYLQGYFKEYTDSSILRTYSVQPKKDVLHVYNYYADGRLAYIEDILGHYPGFPYIVRRYNEKGKLVLITYFENEDIRYLYNQKGKFKGYWYKGKLYNRKGNVKLSS